MFIGGFMFGNFDSDLFNVDGTLCAAVRDGDIARAKKVLDAGASPNAENADFPVLLTSCVNNDMTMFKMLLEAGAEANAKNRFGWSCLHQIVSLYDVGASEGNNNEQLAEALQLIIDSGAYVNRQDRAGETPLVTAIKKNNSFFVRELISHGASVEVLDADGKYPLHYAIKTGNPEIVREIVAIDKLPSTKVQNIKDLNEDDVGYVKEYLKVYYEEIKNAPKEDPVEKKVEVVVEKTEPEVVKTAEEKKISETKSTRKIGRA